MKLSSYLKDRAIANGLPAMAYTDEEFWLRECETVFADIYQYKILLLEKDKKLN